MLLKNVRALRTCSGGIALQYDTCVRHFRKCIAVLQRLFEDLMLLVPFIITKKHLHIILFVLENGSFYMHLHEFRSFVCFGETNPHVVSNHFYENVMMMNVLYVIFLRHNVQIKL